DGPHDPPLYVRAHPRQPDAGRDRRGGPELFLRGARVGVGIPGIRRAGRVPAHGDRSAAAAPGFCDLSPDASGMDGMEQTTNPMKAKNRRVGAVLALIVAGLAIYSFLVIKSRGSLPEPENLSKAQKIFRGL